MEGAVVIMAGTKRKLNLEMMVTHVVDCCSVVKPATQSCVFQYLVLGITAQWKSCSDDSLAMKSSLHGLIFCLGRFL